VALGRDAALVAGAVVVRLADLRELWLGGTRGVAHAGVIDDDHRLVHADDIPAPGASRGPAHNSRVPAPARGGMSGKPLSARG
jgi:hypothetical protein